MLLNKTFKRKNILGVILILFATFFGIIFAQDTFAAQEGWAGGNGYDHLATSNLQSTNKVGATWAYYQYTGSGGAVSVPGGSGDHTVIDNRCRSVGGFYALVGVGINISTGRETGTAIASYQLGSLRNFGGQTTYRTGVSLSNTAGDAVLVRSGDSLETVQAAFLSMPDEYKNGLYWGPNSNLRAFCYGSDAANSGGSSSGSSGGGSNIYATSSVTYGGSTMTSELDGNVTMVISSSIANSSSTVAFTHRLVSDVQPNSGLYNVNVNWSVSGNNASSNSPSSGTRNLSDSGGWTLRPDGKWELVVSVSGTVPLGSRVCQKITYNPKNYVVQADSYSGSGSGSSQACASVGYSPNYAPSCAVLGGASAATINYGDTNGASKVKNLNNIIGETGWQDVVWARPGDTVQFAHCFSWGVQAVRKSDNYGGSRITPSSATTLSDKVDESWFTISSDRGEQYLFGLRKDQGSLGRQIYLSRFNSTAVYSNTGQVIPAESNGNYSLVLMSPSTNSYDESRYNCLVFDFTQFVNNGFQIPGFKPERGNCTSAGVTGQTNEVGQTISQRITFPVQRAWVHESHYKTGSCSCMPINAYANGDEIYFNSQNVGYPGGNGSVASPRYAYTYYRAFGNCYVTSCTGTTGESWCNSTHYQASRCQCTGGKDPYWEHHDAEYQIIYVNGNPVDRVKVRDAWDEYHPLVPNQVDCDGYESYGVSYRYPVHFFENDTTSRVASVNIPYNFRTADTSSINAGNVIYAGESVTSTFTASILPRVNSAIKSTSAAYATVYPNDGDIRIEQFIIGPDTAMPAYSNGVFPVNGSMCSYFGGTQCGAIGINNRDDNWLNSKGLYNGWTWSTSATYNVPNNADIGSKYCVAIGMTISSSHPDAEAQVVNGWHSFNRNWRVSLSCRTIAKKPNFQAWNGNLYAEAGVRTSVSSKYENATLGTNSPADRIFGSWEEYLAVSRGEITGLASGAALGYEGSNLGITGGHGVTNNPCDFSHMSISNLNCSSGSVGYSQISLSNATLSRIFARYVPSSMSVNSGANINVGSASALTNTAGNARTTEYIMTSGNGEINSTIVRGANSPTLVIRVPGTLTINANICAGGGSCSGYDNTLILRDRNSQGFNNIGSLPQVIIIANDIRIGENVTQIDAWLVGIGSSGSSINTCYQFSVGASDSNTCSKTLIINGPVITDTLYLNRSAGALTRSTFGANSADGGSNNLADDGSITPAEIFNYRPDTLLWSYSQSQDYSQATVTYSRELPPRY